VSGRIVSLMIGQGHGFIRLPNEREVYTFIGGSRGSTAFNDLQVGDAVNFELLDRCGERRARAAGRSTKANPGELVEYAIYFGSCFSELLGLPGPSPHQSFAVRARCQSTSCLSSTRRSMFRRSVCREVPC